MTSSKKYKKLKEDILQSKVFIFLLFLVLGAFLFYQIWEDRAYNQTVKHETVWEAFDGKRNVSKNSTIIIENYIPGLKTSVDSRISYIYENQTSGERESEYLGNDAAILKERGVTVVSYSINQEYAGVEITSPTTWKNPDRFPVITAPGMSVTTIVVVWNYSVILPSDGGMVPYFSYGLIDNRLDSDYYESMRLQILSYLFFALAGYSISWLAFSERKLREAYSDLSNFDPFSEKEDDAKPSDTLNKNLNKLLVFPSQVGSLTRATFGISILIFKTTINSKCKKHSENIEGYKIVPYKKAPLKKTLAKYEKQVFKEISDSFPELKTLLVGIGILTSIGISFSWNVGAAASLLISLALVYLFINLGSSVYLIGNSKKDVVLTTGLIILAIIVILFPTIIEALRMIPY